MSILHRLSSRKKRRIKDTMQVSSKVLEENNQKRITGSLEETVHFIKEMLGDSDDFVIKHFRVFGRFRAVMVYFLNLTDQDRINNDILKPLMYVPEHLIGREISLFKLKDVLLEETLYDSQVRLDNRLERLVNVVLRGETVIVIEEAVSCLCIHQFIQKHKIGCSLTRVILGKIPALPVLFLFFIKDKTSL